MNKLFKIITAAAVAGLMSVSLSASASREVCPPHYGGNPIMIPVNNYTIEHNHDYYYDNDLKPHYKKCTITITNYRQETRCVICDELLDSKGVTKTHHSVS